MSLNWLPRAIQTQWPFKNCRDIVIIHKALLCDFFNFPELSTRQATAICSPCKLCSYKTTKNIVDMFLFLNSQRNMVIWIFYWYNWTFEEQTRIYWQECVGRCKQKFLEDHFFCFFVFMGGSQKKDKNCEIPYRHSYWMIAWRKIQLRHSDVFVTWVARCPETSKNNIRDTYELWIL